MKNLFKSLAFVALAATTFTACNEDACKDVVCGDFGTCNEGVCLCETYYEKDADGLCSVLERAKFLGSFVYSEDCQGSTATNTSTVVAHTELSQVKFVNLWGGSIVNGLVGDIAGNEVTIARQEPDNDGFFFEGTGKIEGGVITLEVNITDERDSEDIDTYSCTWTLTK